MRSLSLPLLIQPSTSPARATSSARVRMWCASVGRVRKSDPFWFSTCGSNGPTGPLDWPYSTIMPRGARQFSPFSNVVLPTES